MTTKKQEILAALASGGPIVFFERGAPPYSAADVARVIAEAKLADVDDSYREVDQLAAQLLSGVARTLRTMEKQGLVVAERRKRGTRNAIAGQRVDRMTTCYWVAATMEQDKADAAAWALERERRSEEAWASFGRKLL